MESLSIFINSNNNGKLNYDKENVLTEGTRIFSDGITILRFHNGLLDGDVYDNSGKLTNTKPAVEGPGHIEYWRCGMLHRDNNLPAVSSKGFTVKEYWNNGEYIKTETNE